MPSDTPVLDLLTAMTADSIEATDLSVEAIAVARLAALVAVDAPAASYLLNLGAAAELDLDIDAVSGVLTAVAPIVGTARIVSAAGKIVEALGIAIEAAELGELLEEAAEDGALQMD